MRHLLDLVVIDSVHVTLEPDMSSSSCFKLMNAT